MHDVLQVFHRSSQAVDAGDDERVTWLHEVEQHLQLGAPISAAARGFLGPDDVTAGCFKHGPLQAQVLVDGRNAGVAVERHDESPILSRLSLNPLGKLYQAPKTDPNETQIEFHHDTSMGYTSMGRYSG